MYEFLGIDIKTSDNIGFQFYQTGLIRKVLEETGTNHCNGFTTPNKVESTLATDDNGTEDNIYWSNSYDYVIRMILYLALNTITYIYFAANQCARFTHNKE